MTGPINSHQKNTNEQRSRQRDSVQQDSCQQNKWNQRYRQSDATVGPGDACEVLKQNSHLLPESGVALDLACGLGANALYLAQHGLTVQAWDVSPVAIEKLQRAASQHQLSIAAQAHDVIIDPPGPDSFDVIVVSHFLERQLAPAIIDAIKPEGLIFYQTFIEEKVSNAGPDNPDYRLSCNELLDLFSALRILVYREEGCVGNITRGFRDQAMLVAQKPL